MLKRSRTGVVTSQWEQVEPTRRNEALDTMLYAEAAARRKGWASMTEEQWAALEMERGSAPAEAQADLFDGTAMQVIPAPATPQQPAPRDELRGRFKSKPTGSRFGR